MKYRLKQLISSACALVLLGNIQVASADLASEAEALLNWAENTYPQLFSKPSGDTKPGTLAIPALS